MSKSKGKPGTTKFSGRLAKAGIVVRPTGKSGATEKVSEDEFFNFDAEGICAEASIELAKHHQNSILANNHPNGFPMETEIELRPSTLLRNRGRTGAFFNRTGTRAMKFKLSAVHSDGLGGAKRSLEPPDVPGNPNFHINLWNKRKKSLVSIEGASKDVLDDFEKAIEEGLIGRTTWIYKNKKGKITGPF